MTVAGTHRDIWKVAVLQSQSFNHLKSQVPPQSGRSKPVLLDQSVCTRKVRKAPFKVPSVKLDSGMLKRYYFGTGTACLFTYILKAPAWFKHLSANHVLRKCPLFPPPWVMPKVPPKAHGLAKEKALCNSVKIPTQPNSTSLTRMHANQEVTQTLVQVSSISKNWKIP